MFRLNLTQLIKNKLPESLGGANIADWFDSLAKPIDNLNSTFSDLETKLTRRSLYNGQTHNLERVLNIEFGYTPDPDPLSPSGTNIYIDNLAGTEFAYSFLTTEAIQDIDYSYTLYDNAVSYATDTHIMYDNGTVTKVYRAKSATTIGNDPDTNTPDEWEEIVGAENFGYSIDDVFNQDSFIVYAPVSIISGLTAPEITALQKRIEQLVDTFRQAGKLYDIQTY